MEHALVVHMLHGEAYLSENVDDELLAEETVGVGLGRVVLALLLADHLIKVTVVDEVHHNAQFSFL